MRHSWPRSARWGVLAGLTTLGLSGCSAQSWSVGLLPTERGMTDKVDQVINLWNGSWIAGMLIGLVVWVLIIASIIMFRRRHANDPLPLQTRYNVPLEVVYTVVPFLMIGVLFFFTAKAQADIEKRSDNPDVRIHAIGKQWAWDFNYTDAGVYDTTEQLDMQGQHYPDDKIPTLYLPVNKQVEIRLNSRDVQHSFWVPAFLYKKDMIPGMDTYWTFRPTKTGTFAGKCAELCGEFHSAMLFQVKVVEQAEYDRHMADLKTAGKTGYRGMDLNRETPAQSAGAETRNVKPAEEKKP